MFVFQLGLEYMPTSVCYFYEGYTLPTTSNQTIQNKWQGLATTQVREFLPKDAPEWSNVSKLCLKKAT